MTEEYRVLIVDDDFGQAEMVHEFLNLYGLFQVDLADDLEGLWSCLEKSPYDIVLLDYKLPDGTGLDALMSIADRGYQLPVVMLTGQGDERIAAQAIQRGAMDYLIKSDDYLRTLPALIRKTVRAYQLQLSVQRSLEQIRYQALLLNNVRDAIVVWDMDGKINHWNPAAISLFGWSAEERLGLDVAEVHLPAFSPAVILPKVGDTSGQYVERKYITKDGQTIWVSSRITALRDVTSGGRLIGYMDVSHDITKRKEAEQALRAERNFVSAVLDTVDALVVVLDQQGRVVRFNRACEQITGYSFAEVRGRLVWDIFLSPQDADRFKTLFQQMRVGEFPLDYESMWLTRQGKQRLISWSNTAMTNRQGEVEYVIATGLDVTEQRQAEQALRESETRYRAMVEDYQTELICRFVPDGTLTFTNEVFCRYFGQERDALVGKNFLDFVPDEWRPAVRQHLAAFTPENPVATLEHMVLLPNQEKRWQQRTDRAIYDEEGNLFEFQSVGQDITERKRMEAQIQAAQTHLTQAARLATIGEMASGVAHQINNPLTTIIADAQILLRSLSPDHPSHDSAEAIEQAGWRLQEVVQRLLEFSRPASATLDMVSINQSIQRALLLVGAHIEAIGVNLVAELSADLPPVRGNPRQLEDLWVNLLLLARDATADGRPHTIRFSSSNGHDRSLIVEVCDDGEPIPPEQLDTIFEPNFVGPSSGRGTGMELSICREIVRQHGGQITAESTPARDTIFRVTLPLGNSHSKLQTEL